MQSISPNTSVFLGVDLKAGTRYILFDEELKEKEFRVT